MLAVTHIDLLKKYPEKLDEQCQMVKDAIQKKLEQQKRLSTGKVLQLDVLRGGESLRVNCREGEGVEKLRETLLKATELLPWYAEKLPSAYMELRSKVMELMIQRSAAGCEMSKEGGSEPRGKRRGWIDWRTYYELAHDHCKLDTTNIDIATKFLHETGEHSWCCMPGI